MESKFKLRISRLFHNSCKSRDDVTRDVIEKSPFLISPSPTMTQPQPQPQPQPPSKPLPRPSFCKPRTPPSLHINNTCIISSKEIRHMIPRRHKTRASPRNSKSKSPVPRFAVDPFRDRSGFCYYAVEEDSRKKKKKKKKKKRNKAKALPLFDDHDFFSSDDEREDDEKTAGTLFSSRSLSSSESSFESYSRRRSRRVSRRKLAACDEGIGVLPMCGESVGVRGSFAVVKRSSDPYGDFRTSMVEMIIERQIFGEKELEQLLLCFLSLNSSHHHKVIVEVFTEIWDALFCNWP